MATIIKVNGQTITIANKSEESLSINSIIAESASLESYSEAISKSIEALNLIADTKAMESFGYQSTEGVMDKIKTAGISLLGKLKEFFRKVKEFVLETLPKFFKTVWNKISSKFTGFDPDKFAEELVSKPNSAAIYYKIVIEGKTTLNTFAKAKSLKPGFNISELETVSEETSILTGTVTLEAGRGIYADPIILKIKSMNVKEFKASASKAYDTILADIGSLVKYFESTISNIEKMDTLDTKYISMASKALSNVNTFSAEVSKSYQDVTSAFTKTLKQDIVDAGKSAVEKTKNAADKTVASAKNAVDRNFVKKPQFAVYGNGDNEEDLEYLGKMTDRKADKIRKQTNTGKV